MATIVLKNLYELGIEPKVGDWVTTICNDRIMIGFIDERLTNGDTYWHQGGLIHNQRCMLPITWCKRDQAYPDQKSGESIHNLRMATPGELNSLTTEELAASPLYFCGATIADRWDLI